MRCVLLLSLIFMPWIAKADTDGAATSLYETIYAMDAKLFDSFNRCADVAQLAVHEALFAEDVEFYHDQGGVTWNRADMIANTKNNACGNYTRELITDSFEVYPIQGFGAIAQGTHQFCEHATGRCDGEADFVTVWQQTDQGWIVTRVLSYAHRAAE